MPATNPELLRSLGRLVRGLSALFWGLPLALIVCVGAASAGWLGLFGFMSPAVVTGLLLFGLFQLGAFQPQERPWQRMLDRAKLLALINVGLSPFLFWWNHLPGNPFFSAMVAVMALTGLLFLFVLNLVLLRLGAMLPDETLRHEIRNYTALNRNLVLVIFTLVATYDVLTQVMMRLFPEIPRLPQNVSMLSLQLTISAMGVDSLSAWIILAVLCLLVLLPLSMTMALIWKTKEVILDDVFGGTAG